MYATKIKWNANANILEFLPKIVKLPNYLEKDKTSVCDWLCETFGFPVLAFEVTKEAM